MKNEGKNIAINKIRVHQPSWQTSDVFLKLNVSYAMCLFKPFIKLLSGAVRAKPVLVHVWTETTLVAQVWK